MTQLPEYDVATYLSNTVSTLTSGTNLFVGGMPSESDTVTAVAAAVMLSGGAEPLGFCGQGQGSENYATVQILVRGGKKDYLATVTMARAIYAALKYSELPGYLFAKPAQSGPIYLGLDKDSHHLLSINYELVYDE